MFRRARFVRETHPVRKLGLKPNAKSVCDPSSSYRKVSLCSQIRILNRRIVERRQALWLCQELIRFDTRFAPIVEDDSKCWRQVQIMAVIAPWPGIDSVCVLRCYYCCPQEVA